MGAWLRKSAHDLESARVLGAHPDLGDTAVYHCQQCAEKALKGFLIYFELPPAKTHDVSRLLQLASDVEEGFLSWQDAADRLTYYATAFRYPEVQEGDPDDEMVAEALDDAEVIFRQVLAFLPADLHPGNVQNSGTPAND